MSVDYSQGFIMPYNEIKNIFLYQQQQVKLYMIYMYICMPVNVCPLSINFFLFQSQHSLECLFNQ